jgi:hypothetical protein
VLVVPSLWTDPNRLQMAAVGITKDAAEAALADESLQREVRLLPLPRPTSAPALTPPLPSPPFFHPSSGKCLQLLEEEMDEFDEVRAKHNPTPITLHTLIPLLRFRHTACRDQRSASLSTEGADGAAAHGQGEAIRLCAVSSGGRQDSEDLPQTPAPPSLPLCREIRDEKELFAITTSQPRVVCHFYHADFRTCAIMSKHLETLAGAIGARVHVCHSEREWPACDTLYNVLTHSLAQVRTSRPSLSRWRQRRHPSSRQSSRFAAPHMRDKRLHRHTDTHTH